MDQLVLIADALRLKLQGREYVLYDMAVKPTDRNTAFFLEPVLLEGHESAHGWRQAISGIMLSVRQRIATLVSDGFPRYGFDLRRVRLDSAAVSLAYADDVWRQPQAATPVA